MTHYKNWIQGNLIKQIALAFAILTISRLVWFFANVFWLPPIGIDQYIYAHLIGIYFDLPVVVLLFAPVWIWLLFGGLMREKYPQINRGLFVFSSMVAILFNAIDTGYSQVTAKRSGFELFDSLNDDGNHLAPYLIDNWYIILILVAVAYLIYRMVPMGGNFPRIDFKNRPLRGLLATAAFGGLWLLGFRGGLQLRPLRAIDASNFLAPEIAPLATSTPLQIISTWNHSDLPQFDFNANQNNDFTRGQSACSPLPNTPLMLTKNGKWVKPNIVILVIESLARDYTGFGNGTPFTPFLDKLAADSRTLYFPYCYANGTKSVEMVPSIFCGMPNLMNEFYITSAYATNKINNAFKLAEMNGNYQTSFFHGSNNGTMGFQSFLRQTGLQQYNGIDQYPTKLKNQDFDGNWGIFDEPYLQYVSNRLDSMNSNTRPFFAGIFTLSSHHPYTIPEQYVGKLLGTPKTVQHTIAYSDIALKKFFETLQNNAKKSGPKNNWYNNTIFVITGDHTSHSDREYFYSQSGHYEVPLLIFSPNLIFNENISQLTLQKGLQKTISQCDILPTLWELMGAKQPRLGFGRSAFDQDYLGYSTHIDKDLYYIIHYPFVLALNQKGDVVDFHQQVRNQNKGTKLPASGQKFNWMKSVLRSQMKTYQQQIQRNQWR